MRGDGEYCDAAWTGPGKYDALKAFNEGKEQFRR